MEAESGERNGAKKKGAKQISQCQSSNSHLPASMRERVLIARARDAILIGDPHRCVSDTWRMRADLSDRINANGPATRTHSCSRRLSRYNPIRHALLAQNRLDSLRMHEKRDAEPDLTGLQLASAIVCTIEYAVAYPAAAGFNGSSK